MLHGSTQELIRKLCELTDAGVLAWTAGEANRARLETEGYVVEIDAEPPALRLLHPDGRIFERADAVDLAATTWPGSDVSFASRVGEMANRAQRVARGEGPPVTTALSSLSAPPQKPAVRAAGPIFGAIDTFVRPARSPAAPLMITRLSAYSVQPAEQAGMAQVQRIMASASRPLRPPPQQIERPAYGPHIYKPWI